MLSFSLNYCCHNAVSDVRQVTIQYNTFCDKLCYLRFFFPQLTTCYSVIKCNQADGQIKCLILPFNITSNLKTRSLCWHANAITRG